MIMVLDIYRVLARCYLMKFFLSFSQTILIPQLGLGVLLGLAMIHRKNEIITKKLSQSVPIFHVSLSFICLLFSQHGILYMQFFLNIHKGFSLWEVFP